MMHLRNNIARWNTSYIPNQSITTVAIFVSPPHGKYRPSHAPPVFRQPIAPLLHRMCPCPVLFYPVLFCRALSCRVLSGKVGELLGLWRDEFPKGMPAAEYARKRNQLRAPKVDASVPLCRMGRERGSYAPERVGAGIKGCLLIGVIFFLAPVLRVEKGGSNTFFMTTRSRGALIACVCLFLRLLRFIIHEHLLSVTNLTG